ncbi:MAG: pyroglutamyl-peptidase I [Methyloceanibacter sp.]|nr:pyroglutamyl-peptidase I [Methyloceanibacter sp.]
MSRRQILLTGFGPFPGVPDNPSARLVETLAGVGSFAPRDCELRTEILPTEWGAVAMLVPRLLKSVQPDVTIHFGVSRQARSLRIERSAHNHILPRIDAAGVLPARRTIHVDGPARLDSNVHVPRLAATLRENGVPANSSAHAGSYLCNFLYYHSLAWAMSRDAAAKMLFVHIPVARSEGGPLEDADLLRGAQTILNFMLSTSHKNQIPAERVRMASRGR